MEFLLSLDQQWFSLIGQMIHPVWLDEVAKFLSGIGRWGGVWIVIVLVLFFREEKKDRLFFLPTTIVMVAAVISEFILKEWIARPRPVQEGVSLIRAPDSFSFPSSHAFIAFAFATILSYKETKGKVFFHLLALLIALSRIYLGVHYPLDIIGGMILGIVVGHIALWAEKQNL